MEADAADRYAAAPLGRLEGVPTLDLDTLQVSAQAAAEAIRDWIATGEMHARGDI